MSSRPLPTPTSVDAGVVTGTMARGSILKGDWFNFIFYPCVIYLDMENVGGKKNARNCVGMSHKSRKAW